MEIVPQWDILFRRFSNMAEQCNPKNHTDMETLFQYFNITSEIDKHLFIVYLIALFIPHIDFPILVLNGDAWSGKTSFFRFMKELIDPPVQKKLTGYIFPSKPKDLEIQLTRWYFHCYDNLSDLRKDTSDIFCQVVTGGWYSTKENYSDEEMIDRTFIVRLWIGSIEKVVWFKDLIDRSLMFTLQPIKRTMNPDKMNESFYTDKPQILDLIFCTIARALSDTEVINDLPRMWDFALWWERISRALWFKKGLFLARYRERIHQQHHDINTEIVPEWVQTLIEHVLSTTDEWDDEPNKLYKIARDELGLTDIPNDLGLFGKRLYSYSENLKVLWIVIGHWHSCRRNVYIWRIHPKTKNKTDGKDASDANFEKPDSDTPLSPNLTNML